MSTSNSTFTNITGSTFILRTDAGDVLLPINQVRTLTVKNMNTTLARTITTTTRAKQLTFRFEKPNVKREMLVMYFRPGIRWIPTYRINLSKDQKKKTATISLQAEIINEAEDLDGVPMDIVVGVPNFRFRNTVSPLILESTLRNTLHAAAPQLMGQFRNDMSNALYTQRSSEFRRGAAQANAARHTQPVKLPGELTATGAQDLFVYNLPKMKLKKGERAAVHIFTTEVPYRDVYTWDVHLKRQDIETAPSGSGVKSPLKLSKNEVWHQIELTNNTNVPWTTGAAMIMMGNQRLAQELLTYTSPKDAARVPVTVSIDTRGSFDEKEISRQMKALTWARGYYAKISKKAKLDLCNNKGVPIEVEVTLRLGGKVDQATQKGAITLGAFNAADWERYRGDAAVNNTSTVKWTVKLKAGETFEPEIMYYYYARHY